MGGWVDGWMGGWVDGWMGGWDAADVHSPFHSPTPPLNKQKIKIKNFYSVIW